VGRPPSRREGRRNEGGEPRRGVHGTGIISCWALTVMGFSIAARPVGEKTGRGNQASERSTPRFCWLCYRVSQTTPNKRHAAGFKGRALIVGSGDQQGLRRRPSEMDRQPCFMVAGTRSSTWIETAQALPKSGGLGIWQFGFGSSTKTGQGWNATSRTD